MRDPVATETLWIFHRKELGQVHFMNEPDPVPTHPMMAHALTSSSP